MKHRSFGQERKPYDWKDPQYGYEVDEISFEEMMRQVVEQQWADTEKEALK